MNQEAVQCDDKPRLFFDTSSDSHEAVQAILESGIPCHLPGPLSEVTLPLLVVGFSRFVGLPGVVEFIERYQKLHSEALSVDEDRVAESGTGEESLTN